MKQRSRKPPPELRSAERSWNLAALLVGVGHANDCIKISDLAKAVGVSVRGAQRMLNAMGHFKDLPLPIYTRKRPGENWDGYYMRPEDLMKCLLEYRIPSRRLTLRADSV